VYVSKTCTYTRNRCNSRNINIWRIYFHRSTKSAILHSLITVTSFHRARPNSIFVFDDVACDKQDTVKEYFSMGRHSHWVDCFYLCQSNARIPKHLIRDNANLLILFKQDGINLKHVYNDHVNTDMSYEDFSELCCNCWQQKYGFLVIDKDNALTNGRYRKGFNEFAIPRSG